MKAYDDAFKPFSYFTAQILVTFWDLDSRHVYKHARATVDELLRMPRCVPIFNENDALSFEEIQMLNSFGDNDRLSAHIAILTGATRLIILSDVDGLKTSPDGKGKLISKVTKVDETIRKYAGGTKSRTSIGGMTSKIESADLMIEHGITTVIANGREDDVLVKFARGVRLGTWFEVNR
jgi:glutamate 5-kinase